MLRTFIIMLSFALSGCALGPRMIKSDTIAFDDVIEDTTNKMLLLNVLRARDKAPLHFSDIPVIRESLPQNYTMGLSKVISANQRGTVPRDLLVGGMSLGVTPSFDLNHLNSKEFATGIASPIDPKIVKYWLDRGLDRRIVLLLFFSAVEIVETPAAGGPQRSIRVMNSPRDAIDVIRRRAQPLSATEELRCDGQSDFERYLKLFNSLTRFSAHSYRERRLLAKGMNLDQEKDGRTLQSFAALDQNKIQLVYDKGLAAYNLYALSAEPKIAFCFQDESQPGRPSQYESMTAGTGGGDRRSCSQAIVDILPEDSTHPPAGEAPVFFGGPAAVAKPTNYCAIYNRFTLAQAAQTAESPNRELRLYLRSVGEIFEFLGDLLQYQDEVKRHIDANPATPVKLNTPVTFGFCGDRPVPGCDDIFFRLDGDACNARFTLNYRDQQYSVANYNPPARGNACNAQQALPRDHSLEVLAVLHQLVGINKAASDVKTTPFVQVLP